MTCANQRERKLFSDHRQRLQQLLLAGGQAIDARRENRLHGRRNLQLGQRLGELDRRRVAHQRALVEQHLYRLFHEERIALGLLDDQALERRQLGAVTEQR